MGRWKKGKPRHKDTTTPGGKYLKWIVYVYRKQDTHRVTDVFVFLCPAVGLGVQLDLQAIRMQREPMDQLSFPLQMKKRSPGEKCRAKPHIPIPQVAS